MSETVEKIYLIEITATIYNDETERTHNVYVKARDLEEAIERAVGRFAWNNGHLVRICRVREVIQ